MTCNVKATEPVMFEPASEYDVGIFVRDMNAQSWSDCLKVNFGQVLMNI